MTSAAHPRPSLWTATAPSTDYPVLDGSVSADVTVIGAGVAGLLTAMRLHEAGLDVVLVDAGKVGGVVTARSTAKVTAQHGRCYSRLASALGKERARIYAAANQAGVDRFAELVERHEIDCDFTRAASYVYTLAADQVASLEDEAAAANQAGLPATFTTETDLPYRVKAAVRIDDQAHIHPVRFCQAVAGRLRDGGVAVFESSRVTGINAGSTSVVRTAHGEVRSRSVVLATQLPLLDRGLHFATAHGTRSYGMAIRVSGAVPAGMYLSVDQPTRSLRPAMGGSHLVVGGESHRVGEGIESEHAEQLAAWAREQFDVLAVEQQWSAHDYIPTDGVPFIGRLWKGPGRVFVATGFQKWGFSTSAVAAEIITGEIVGDPYWAAPLFDATRRPRYGLRSLLGSNVNVAKHFVLDRVAPVVGSSVDDVAPGQGAVVRQGIHTVAAYREPNGTLHAVSPTCTHLRCTVAFNDADVTWDCPCHGSRFTVDGEVIQGPATRPLRQVHVHVRQAAT